MEYYIIVLNHNGDTLAVFDTFTEAVEYATKGGLHIASYRLQLMPIGGI